jgi:hypothetical protein
MLITIPYIYMAIDFTWLDGDLRILTPIRILQDIISLIRLRRLQLEFLMMDGQRSDLEQITFGG